MNAITQIPIHNTHHEATMTLKEITDLLEVEHNKAMKVVAKMTKSEGFGTVAKVATVYNNKGQTVQTYQLNRRQSMAVAARLNTDLLMKVIDRLDELEQQPAELSYDEIMNRALTMSSAKVHALEVDKKNLLTQVEQIKPKADALDRIADTTGNICVTDAAKVLQSKPKTLFAWLSDHKWIYRRVGTGWIGFQNRIDQGVLQHKVVTIITGGQQKIREQVLITPKGLATLAEAFELEVVA